MLHTAPALLALFLGAAPAPAVAVQDAKAPMIEEKESDHEYPAWIQSTLKKDAAKDTKPATLDLMGLGIREKTIFNVNVTRTKLNSERHGWVKQWLMAQ